MAPDPEDPGAPLGEGALGEGVLGPEPEAEEEAAAENPFGWFRGFARYGYVAPALAFLASAGLTFVPTAPAEAAEELTPVSADITTAYPRGRCLFYQSLFFVPQPPPPAALEVAVAPIAAPSPFGRTLQYQSKVYLAKPPEVGAEAVTPDKWQIQWKGPPRRLIRPVVVPSLTPKTIEVVTAEDVDPSKWMMRWQGPPRIKIRPVVSPPLTPKTIEVVESRGTPDSWMPAWRGPSGLPVARSAAPPALPEPEAAPEFEGQGSFPISALSPFGRPLYYQAKIAPPPPVEEVVVEEVEGVSADVTSAYPSKRSLFYQSLFEAYAAPVAVVTVTPDQWLPRWQGPPRRLLELPGGPSFVAFTPQPVTTEWLRPFDRAVKAPRPKVLAQPFVPREATLENTVPGGWWQPFTPPVPARPVWQTQPFYGYPYLGVDNFRPQWDWTIQWPERAPRFWWKAKPYQPFVPREATIDNTLTGIGWWVNLSTAPNKPNFVWRTQPFYGFPYEAADNTRTEWDWHIAWQGPPKYRPQKVLAQPFVPKEATLENTVDQGWRVPLSEPVAARPVWPTQPFYGYPYESVFVDNSGTVDTWLRPLSVAVKHWWPPRPAQPFIPEEAVIENTITGLGWWRPLGTPVPPRSVWWTQPFYGFPYAAEVVVGPDKWLIRWDRPPRYRQQKVIAQPFVPREATIDNTLRGIGWHRPLGIAVPARPVWWTQPFFGYPYEARPFVSLDDVDPCRTVNVGALDRGFDVPAKVTVNVRFTEDAVTPTPKQDVDVKPLNKTTDVDCK